MAFARLPGAFYHAAIGCAAALILVMGNALELLKPQVIGERIET